ncbi:MAG TPA: hypothetical protein VIO32_08735, partial [Candidatus Baltobacteraceae bacterium]
GLSTGLWHSVTSGESTFVAPLPDDPSTTIGSGYYSYLARLNTPTGELKNISPWPKYMSGASAMETKYRFSWTHPIFFSPANPHDLFVASQVVFKSTDYGQTWQIISPDLTRNDKRTEQPSGGPIDLDQSNAETYPDISALAVSPLSANVMWAGSADGLVHITTDAGAHWKSITPPQIPQTAQISSIEPSHTDAGTAYLTANRYMWDDFHPYVYKTTDYGAHWTAITAGLPDDQFVFAIRQDPREPRLLFAGTRSTVYVSFNGGNSWQSLQENLPNVQVRDIAIDARQGDLALATHGRAFWILDNLKLLEDIALRQAQGSSMPQNDAVLFRPEGAWLSHAYGRAGYGSDLGQNPSYGAAVFFNVPKSYNGKTPATLTFLDSSGKTVRTFNLHLRNKKEKRPPYMAIAAMAHADQMAYELKQATAIDPGMNLFQWDMRYPPATEITGYHIPTSDDISDSVDGPTIVPGSYTVELSYGGKTMRQSFTVSVDPRLHPATEDLAARLALAMEIRDQLSALNTTVNEAIAARAHLPSAKRAALDRELANVVEMRIRSSEGDLMHEVRMRDYLAFLMNELDIGYQPPTAAEQSTWHELRPQAQADIAALRSLMR